MSEIESRATDDVASCENSLIAKAAEQGITFVQFISDRYSVSTKERQAVDDPPKPDFKALRAAMRAGSGREAFTKAFGPTRASLCEEVRAFHAALGGGEVSGTLIVELELVGDEYRLRHSFEFGEISPAHVVLDPEYRYPNHPLPGMPHPGGIEVTDRPTDPEVLAEIGSLVREFRDRYTAIIGKAPELGEGSSEAKILASEMSMGLRLPEDLRALYRTVHDDTGESGLLGAQALLPLEHVARGYRNGDPGTVVETGDLFPVTSPMFDSDPPGHVRRLARND